MYTYIFFLFNKKSFPSDEIYEQIHHDKTEKFKSSQERKEQEEKQRGEKERERERRGGRKI